MRYLSVCSGIEAATVAWHPLGWQPVAFSEIEPFPSAVLAHHYPNVPNLGDMTKFQEWPDEPVELLVGGTPCQSFSVAGLRKGLEDPRGNLMLTYLAIAQRYRPRWVVWENVPGVLSSNGGRDFGTFLGALGELGYGWTYRVLDAQWFGVAQRRRRVFVVGYLGDWQRAAQVLFERESVRRDTPPRRQAREGAAGSVTHGIGVGSEIARALTAAHTATGRLDPHEATFVSQYLGNAEGGAREVPFLTCHNIGGTAGISNQTPLVAQVFKVRGGVEREDGSRGSTNIGKQAGKGYLGSEERAFTLAAAQDQFVAQPIPIHDQATRHAGKRGEHSDGKGNGLGVGQPGDPAPTLTKGDKHAVAQPIPFRKSRRAQSVDDHETWVEDGVSNTLNCFDVGDVRAVDVVAQPVATAMQVRRLTPVECERLQGFPDGYTNIPWRKKNEAPDGPRYKALGNSMAVPCMAWIGKRIAEVDRG
jgi:DNA (cytosine-5)-methyltransferase 1